MNDFTGRTLSVGIVFTIILIILIGKIGYIQIVKGEEYQKQAIIQQVSKIDQEITPIRGSILDRNNYELAISRRVYNVVLDSINFAEQKEDIREKQIVKMSSLLGISADDLRSFTKLDTHYKVIKKGVTKEVVDEMKNLNMLNLFYEETYKRKYIYDSFAANLIGFSNDAKGLWGVEKEYDSYLHGTEGRKFITFKGNNMLVQDQVEAKDGYNIILTIDKNIQDILEKNLQDIVNIDKPLNSSIIAMNPNTGEILGMASYPNFDLNKPMEIPNETITKKFDDYKDKSLEEKLNVLWRNFVINDTYEPGSTFKAVTVASALEEGVINENSTFDCPGYKVIFGVTIHCGKRSGHGHQTLEQALANSCNVAMMDIVEKMMKEKFSHYQKLFGFGHTTGIDLQGEADGILFNEKALGPTELATSSFGQRFTVTPIQMLTAFSSIINGGKLVKPYTVSRVVDNNLNVITQNQPTVVRKTISNKTSDIMKKYLESVVAEGTGSKAKVEGYRIGGKTATSEKGTDKTKIKYIVSFIAFAPADDPQVILLTLIDEPTVDIYSPDLLSAPTASGRCMEAILKYMGIPKIENADTAKTKVNVTSQMVMLDDYTNQNVVDAVLKMKSENINYKIIGNGSNIVNQVPKSNTLIPHDREVLIYVEANEGDNIVVPNLLGKSYEEAAKALLDNGLTIKTSGSNGKTISEQVPQAGTKVPSNSSVYVKFNGPEASNTTAEEPNNRTQTIDTEEPVQTID